MNFGFVMLIQLILFSFTHQINNTVSETVDQADVVYHEVDAKDDSLSKWKVKKIDNVLLPVDDTCPMVCAMVSKGGKDDLWCVRMNAEAFAQFFPVDFVCHLNSDVTSKNGVVAYAETLGNQERGHLIDMIANQGWSKKIKKMVCQHDSAAGWTTLDQPAYFKVGCRYYETRCPGCNKMFVPSATKSLDEHRVGLSASERVYVCASDAIADCRCVMCGPCWQVRFSDESRSKRVRKPVVYIRN